MREAQVIALMSCVGLAALGLAVAQGPALWAHTATAQGADRWQEQVVLFRGELANGRRIDRADPYLPRLDAEGEEGRRLNYERCTVAIEQKMASGQVRALRYDQPRTLFAVEVDGKRWAEDPDTDMLSDVECVFTAGDVRRHLRFPVLDETGRPLGDWWGGRFQGAPPRN